MSDTLISVLGGVLVTGIPETRRDSTLLGLVEWSVSVGVGFVGPAVCGAVCVYVGGGRAARYWCDPAGWGFVIVY